jgi:DNA polymerase-1
MSKLAKIAVGWKKAKSIAVAYDFDAKGEIHGAAFSVEPRTAYYLPTNRYVQFSTRYFEGHFLIGHDLKAGLRISFQQFRHSVNSVKNSPAFFDTALAHAVVFPDLRHTLAFAAESLLNYTPIPEEKASGQQDFLAAMESPDAAQLSARRTMERADLALQLHALLVPKLKESGQEKVFTEIESPLLPVLAAMENEGIRLDPIALEDVGKKLRADLARLEASIYQHAGTTFNIGSPKQLGEILFGKLALSKDAKKTKTGQYSTDEQTLAALAPLHPIIGEVLEHREASKLLSTYIDALPASIAVDGRVHTTFYQLATSTGRLNSQDPNLQNIPIRTAQGREIRRAFVSREGDYQILSADYSQIELRILAALTQDPGLLDGLTSGEDIHRATAAKVFGLPIAEVTKAQRNQAKMVNYGISYGISAFGLSQRLGIPRADAKNLIEGYFAQYPGIKKYMTDTVAQARERGYVETITPLPARFAFRQRHRPRRRRTQRHQHADPGFQRRSHQNRHGANRENRPRGKLAHEIAAPGP